jgi:hypothetical protein
MKSSFFIWRGPYSLREVQDEDEEIEIVRVSLNALPELIRTREIVDAKTIIGIQHLLLSRAE